MSYFTKKIADWSNPKQKMYLTPLSCSPDSDSSNSSTDSINAKKQLFELPANNSTPTSNKKSSKSSKHNNSAKLSTAFDNVEQKSLTGRLNVNIVEGRKLNVSNFQSRPYCVVEFDRDQFVTREAIRDSDLPIQRGGKPVDFLDLVRAARCPIWKQKVTFDVARLDSELQVSVYERVHHLDNAQTEVFLGTLKIQPPKKPNQPIDGKESVTGELHKSNLKPGSFEILKLIGKGNFGKVFQVRKKDTNRIYAMKVLHKQDLIERREVEHTLAEKNILIRAESCPFLVGLKFSFQTRTHLYLVTDFMNGGELFWHLQNEVRLSEERAKFYAAEIVLALEHLHKYNIVYRDLKPENILLDATGHIALCDFGLCKENLATGQTTNTFCGTSEYLAPEVLAECGYGKSVDWWSLGILFYEMIAGFSPFYTNDTQLMYRRILFGKLKFPKGFFSDDAKSLIKGLLARNPHNRLGSNGDAEDLKRHPFFANVDWNALYNKQVPPPFKPNVTSEDDTSCFDPAFTEEQIDYWPSLTKNISRNGTNASIASELNDTFVGFTYSGEPTTTLNIGGCCGLQVNNTVASISPVQVIGGVVIIITVYIRRKFVKPPPEFKDIPTISPIQLIKTLISGRPHDEVQKVMEAAHNQYGIVKIWYVVRWGIHISKLEYVKEFLTEPIDNVPKITYSPDSAVSKFLGVGLFTSNDETWKVHRNISAKAFNKALSPKIIGECGIDSVKLIEKWENTPMDTFLLMQRITLQALGKVAFGYDFQCLKNWEEQPEFIETYHSIMNHVMAPRTFFFPFLDKLPLNSNIRYRMLKAAENEDYTWSARSLRDEIVILFVAGHDTTAHSLSVVFYYLGRYLDIQEKAREEVVRIIGKDLVIPTSDQLKELKYVNAIIKEALRLYPSLTTAPPRIIQRDFQFDNFLIPKGTYLQVNYWQIHHNPEIYPRPYEFIPERWLDNHPMSLNANQEKRHAFSWLPFSAGPRNW
ncbi:15311_t:CDS:10 [Entrophospora sp. SA101]|nr:15311_t:CDS:10 [Entrophospora sp. SA101]CAJ0833409.1 14303_t:CDS:10 [Entrophospora sp. SA101]